MSQPPSSWDPHAGQQDYPQGPQNPYGSTESFQQQPPSQPAYVPPPQYGGYPPAAYGAPSVAYGAPYGQPGYPPPYGGPVGPQRPGAALAAAVLSYVQAGIVLICSFFVLAVGTANTEALLIGILQLISVGLLIFAAVQITSGTGRTMMLIASGVQLGLVVYYMIRFSSYSNDFDFQDSNGAVVIPLFFAVMPAVAFCLALSSAVTRFIADKQSQAQAQNTPWGR